MPTARIAKGIADDNSVQRERREVRLSEAVAKHLSEMLKEDEAVTLQNTIKKRVLKIPDDMRISNAEVAKEPLLWALLVHLLQPTLADFEDRYGVPGPLSMAFERALTLAYTENDVPLSDWVKVRIARLASSFLQIGRSVLRYPAVDANPVAFLTEIQEFLKDATDKITALDRDFIKKVCGPKAAKVYAASIRLRVDLFPERFKFAIHAVGKSMRNQGANVPGLDAYGSDDDGERPAKTARRQGGDSKKNRRKKTKGKTAKEPKE